MIKHFFTLAVVYLLLGNSNAFSKTIEAYGDSLTAAFLSHTSLVQPPSLNEVSNIISDIVLFKLTEDKSILKAHHHPDGAWPVQLAQLAENKKEAIFIDNRAVTGSKTIDIYDQVRAASYTDPAAMAFFFIGHNDLCKNTDAPEVIAEQYAEELNLALNAWEARHDGAIAYLMPVGKIYQVYQKLDGFTWTDNKRRLSCNDNWQRYFPYCPFFYRLYEENRLESYLAPRIEAMNEALDQIAKQRSLLSEKNHYYYLDNLHSTEYEAKHFAIDCYHLSTLGQQTLANEVWKRLIE